MWTLASANSSFMMCLQLFLKKPIGVGVYGGLNAFYNVSERIVHFFDRVIVGLIPHVYGMLV